ncbi:MAG: hypothetical protein R2911_21295 [Caldilineaceae bacterium]
MGNQPITPEAARSAQPVYLADLATFTVRPARRRLAAVFAETLTDGADLTAAALAKYKYFVGDLWDQYGEDAWMGPWKEVYARPADAAHDIVAELRAIDDPVAALSAPMILDNVENADQTCAALSPRPLTMPM